MRFSLAFTSATLFLARLTSALPASTSPTSLVRRDGPSGSKAETEEATTSTLNITLRTFDGKVTYNSNVINLVQTLASPDDQSTIDAYLRIPQLVAGYDNPSQSSWVAHLEITETQTGSLGAAPFLAAAPCITIQNT